MLDAREHDLRDLQAARHREWLIAEIDEDRLDLAAIVAVDRARRVQQRDAVMQRESGARTHLAFVFVGERDRDAARDRRARAGLQFNVGIDGGQKIERRRSFRRIGRHRQVFGVGQA